MTGMCPDRPESGKGLHHWANRLPLLRTGRNRGRGCTTGRTDCPYCGQAGIGGGAVREEDEYEQSQDKE